MKKVLILILLLLLPTNAYAMLSMLQGGSEGADLATSGTEYLPARGGIDPDTTESTKQTLISEAGTVKTFYVELRTAPGAVTTRTFTLRKNGSNQSLTVTISGTDTTGSDLSNSFTVVAGDRLTISSTVTGTPAASVVFWSMLFDSSTAKRSILNGNRSTISTTVGNYVSLGGHTGTSIETSEFANEILIPTSGTIKNLYVELSASPGASKSRAFTVYKNSLLTTLAKTVSDSDTTGNNTSDSFSVSAGDAIVILTSPSGTPSASDVYVCVTFEANNDGEFILAMSTDDLVPGGTNTEFIQVTSGDAFWWNTEASEFNQQQLSDRCLIKNIYFETTGSGPGVGKSWVLTFRNASANSALTLTISESSISGNASADVLVTAGSRITTQTVGVNTASSGGFSHISYLAIIDVSEGDFVGVVA